MWTYNGKKFNSEDIGDNIGFVYLLTHKETDMKYVGKKLFVSVKKLPPLKGKTRKRTKIVETDWQDYYGSSDETKALVEEFGGDIFKREILHLCKTKGHMSYLELKEQVVRDVLLRDDYLNGIIQCRIHKNHAKGVDKT